MGAFVVNDEDYVVFQSNSGIVPVKDKDSATFDITGTIVSIGNVRSTEIRACDACYFYHELVGSVSVATLNVV